MPYTTAYTHSQDGECVYDVHPDIDHVKWGPQSFLDRTDTKTVATSLKSTDKCSQALLRFKLKYRQSVLESCGCNGLDRKGH